MKKRIVGYIQKNWLVLILSFLIPVIIMIIVYSMNGIYIGSERSIMASDSLSQYSNFHASFNNVLHGEQSMFYTWYGSLGLNYWAFAAYYVNSIFTPLVALFDNAAMPDALYVITLIKFGFIGLSFYVFAEQTYKKMSRWQQLSFSSTYALMGYTVAYSPVIMWLDAFVYLPWIILGIHRILDGKKPGILFLSYLLLFLSNFYMAFMIGVFSFLYYCMHLIIDWSRYKKTIYPYMITSLLAGGASMLTVLPTILDLTNNGEGLNKIDRLFTPDTGGWDFIVKSMVAVYDTSKYESAPFIYIGLLPLIFCCFYFVSDKFSLRSKLCYGTLFILLIASVYIDPLNLFWHGLHAPNMFLFRFSFLFSFLVILFGGYGFEAFDKKDQNKLMNILLIIGSLFIAAILLSNPKRYNYITNESLYLTIGFLALYAVCLLLYGKTDKLRIYIPIFLFLLMSTETFFNAKGLIAGVGADWGYPGRYYYSESYSDVEKLVNQTKKENDTFYRMENLDRANLNDSFTHGYSGVTMFSSIRNRHSSAYLNNLGFRSLGTNLTINYDNNTLFMDSLLGIKYNIAKDDPMKFGYEKISESGDYALYENSYALPLGILTDDGIFETDAVKNQTALFNHLAETNEIMTEVVEPRQVTIENAVVATSGKEQIYTEISPGKEKVITWSVYVPAGHQAYLSIYPTDMMYMLEGSVKTTVNGVTRETTITSSGQYYNLGDYETGTTVEVKAVFTGTRMIKIYKPDVLLLDSTKFEQAVEAVQAKGVSFETTGRTATAKVKLAKDQVLFTTIPYDAGWTAYIDGEKIEIPTFKNAFLTLAIPAGTHEIEFVFLPQGLKTGLILFAGCIALFLLYRRYEDRLIRRKEESSNE
ncbi:YfhO family protein [Enterococcus sp. BWT-B8]|uniref:YfhO family protein n=1 Tax=Enterococcus sp. BWT-B8 TaxID=2885157 RepID=UPI001E4CDC0E|nr:YfhO family protein [Enterococcus sp. BWT-B8]MCB5952640.1 YfhO family protein [Enterococcus sp. BWT-B8]